MPGGEGFIYGIDIPRFRDSDGDGMGDLAGVVEKLDYIASLGAGWIWLMPFYPSARRDNGYDVDEHRAVGERLGTVGGFEKLVEEAHAVGLRVMLDLVLHHTSDRHPWFLASREGEHPYRHYYRWRREPRTPEEDPPMFPGEEPGTWSYDGARGRWYRHSFSHVEPDLDLDADEVREELARIAEFWIDAGADGFRIDAAAPIAHENAGGAAFFDELRDAIARRAPGTVLMGESDVTPDESREYFDDGRFDALLGFTLNNRMVLAISREDARPVAHTLEALARLGADRWVPFLHTHDELDLEQLSDAERREVMERFAPLPGERIYGRGIRRGWASMMADERAHAMSLSLLFAFPGTPLLIAGQELGMGDDLGAPGRSSVRLAMQWDAGDGMGFTSAASSAFIRPPQRSGPRAAQHVNVARQLRDPDSPLALVRSLASVRRPEPEFEIAALPGDDPSPVLVAHGERGTTVHNFSPHEVELELALGRHLFGPYDGGSIGPYEYGWFEAR